MYNIQNQKHHEPFDNSNLTAEKENELVTEYKYLVPITIGKKFPNAHSFLSYHGLDREDIEQYGLIGLSKAIKNYDASKGTEFSSHAINYIYYYINYYAKKDSLYSVNSYSFDLVSSVSLDNDEVYDFNKRAVEVEMTKIDAEHNIKLEYLLDRIEEVRGKVPDRLIYIMQEKVKGYNNAQIAKQLGITRQAVESQLNRFKNVVTELIIAS